MVSVLPFVYIENLTTIGPVVSEIICLIKIRTDRYAETEDIFFRVVGVTKRRENITKVKKYHSINETLTSKIWFLNDANKISSSLIFDMYFTPAK